MTSETRGRFHGHSPADTLHEGFLRWVEDVAADDCQGTIDDIKASLYETLSLFRRKELASVFCSFRTFVETPSLCLCGHRGGCDRFQEALGVALRRANLAGVKELDDLVGDCAQTNVYEVLCEKLPALGTYHLDLLTHALTDDGF